MNAQRLWIGATVLLTVAMSAWLLGQLMPTAVIPHPPASGVDYRASDITLTQMRIDGKPRYRLRAATLTHTLPDDITHLDDVVLTVYPQQGTPVTLTSPSAQVLADGIHIYLPKQVVITRPTPSGEISLTTSNLTVDTRAQTATSKTASTLSGPGYHTQGIGLRADFADHVFDLLHDVRSTYQH